MADQELDAQQVMEKHALRNVRGLVENLESSDAASKRLQKRVVVGVVAVIAILLVLAATGVNPFRGKTGEVAVPASPTTAGY